MDILDRVVRPGERLLSFFRATLETVGAGILVLTDRRIIWVTETAGETEIDADDMIWVSRHGPKVRVTLKQGSFKFLLPSEAAATSATSYLLACVERQNKVPGSASDTVHPTDELPPPPPTRGGSPHEIPRPPDDIDIGPAAPTIED